MLNNCKYFGNYFGVKSFRYTFAANFSHKNQYHNARTNN